MARLKKLVGLTLAVVLATALVAYMLRPSATPTTTSNTTEPPADQMCPSRHGHTCGTIPSTTNGGQGSNGGSNGDHDTDDHDDHGDHGGHSDDDHDGGAGDRDGIAADRDAADPVDNRHIREAELVLRPLRERGEILDRHRTVHLVI